jgi:hypothetical protein
MLTLLCFLGFHRRSGSHAFEDEAGTFVSICRRCGRAMERRETGKWTVRTSSRATNRPSVDDASPAT